MPPWQRRQILIWGKTRPELSHTYREIVCTGGVFRDSGKLVRLYPIPLRFMDDERLFAKYQWIEADVMRNERDPRPESYKVKFGDIKVLDKVKTKKGGDWSLRAPFVLQTQNVFASVEALKERQAADGTSLGVVRPKCIKSITSQFVGASEKASLMARWDDCRKQVELSLEGEAIRDVTPLQAPDYWYRIAFNCDDARCSGHEMKVLDWEVDAYYWRRRHEKRESDDRAAKEVLKHLETVTGPQYDTRFFLGNINNHPQNFTIVGLWRPKRQVLP